MASPGELVRTVAEALGIPRPTVVVHDRNLVKAGLRSKGGRGRSAAKVTASDAANLLIAVAGSVWYHSGIKDTVAIVEDYAPLRAAGSEYSVSKKVKPGYFTGDWQSSAGPSWELKRLPLAHLKELSPGHSFSEALAAIITAASDGSLMEAVNVVPRETGHGLIIEVHIVGPRPHAVIHINLFDYTEEMHYVPSNEPLPSDGNWGAWEQELRQKFGGGDLKQIRLFSQETIFAIGNLLGERR